MNDNNDIETQTLTFKDVDKRYAFFLRELIDGKMSHKNMTRQEAFNEMVRTVANVWWGDSPEGIKRVEKDYGIDLKPKMDVPYNWPSGFDWPSNIPD